MRSEKLRKLSQAGITVLCNRQQLYVAPSTQSFSDCVLARPTADQQDPLPTRV
jgi:hypothetical protein